ncbi:hypothetical protein FHS18_001760 [Paenibacillus phyllosphaerae]|uniref:SR1 protein n=1 Tax=Paenibacillus phyllosphaerae TaxID=274593 RepID=A0A7W5AW56_9BACL|nr:GapA-binding peptide SR1P [Paenibacillus phyllosphaerae]MBB3109697.1 hypothetical protein [Paenibacillus phyllosphaerae]
MPNTTGDLNLGTVICKHCNEIMDTVDTERVTFFYIVCARPECSGEAERQMEVESLNA